MERPSITVEMLGPDAAGTTRAVSPGVGWWSDHPAAGALLGPGSSIGTLRRLHRVAVLRLPQGLAGRVESAPAQRIVAVEFGQSLLELAPVESGADAAGPAADTGVGAASDLGLGEDCRAVVAPTDGVFYRSPAPDAPPFVEPGTRLRSGQPIGLVEVMKTFNQILYGGPGLPEEAEVVEVRAADAQEVSAGQILIVVR